MIYILNVAKIMLTYVREELTTPLQSIFRFDRNTHTHLCIQCVTS